eukprot:2898113-Pyramimonas_sp.AAC.1
MNTRKTTWKAKSCSMQSKWEAYEFNPALPGTPGPQAAGSGAPPHIKPRDDGRAALRGPTRADVA